MHKRYQFKHILTGQLRNIDSSISCHINKDVTVTSSCSHCEGELVSPEGTQEGKNTRYLATIRLYPLLAVSPEELWIETELHPEGTQDRKEQGTGPKLRCSSKE